MTVRTRAMYVRNSSMYLVRKARGGLVGDFAVAGERLRGIPDVGLGCGHLARVAEAEYPAQALLGHRRADLPGRRPDDGGGHLVERVLTPGPRRPVDRILEGARDRPVVLGCDEQDGVRVGNRFLECPGLGREVSVVVLAVERQIPDRDLGELEIVRCELDQRLRQFAVDRGGGEAPHEIADFVRAHRLPFLAASYRTRRASIGRPVPTDAVRSGVVTADCQTASASRRTPAGCR